ncbi:hypothetical protein Gorai_019382, partial [Gossypium raimondii]|nr:hypothetical protein [Gossypium raimondii]
MEKLKKETEPKSSSTQSMAQEPNAKVDPKNSDPEMDAEGFVIVPTTEPEKEKEKEGQIQNEQSPNQAQSGLRNLVHPLDSGSPAADRDANMSAPNRYNPNLAQAPAMDSSSASFKGKEDGYSEGCLLEMEEDSGRSDEESRGSCRKHVAT